VAARRTPRIAVLVLALLAGSLAGAAEVVGLTVSSVYLDVGREDGLREGDRVEVLRGDAVVALLEVEYLASHRASCKILEVVSPIEQGDPVRFTARPVSGTDERPRSPTTRKRTRGQRSWARRNGLRGRVGLRFLSVRDRAQGGAELTQPAVDLRVEGRRVGGSPMGLSIDVRGRRTSTVLADDTRTSQDNTRVYRAALSVNELRSGMTLTAGRQYSSALAAVSLFDGLLADFRHDKWAVGAFSGTQPDPVDFGYATDVREHGVYVEAHNRPDAGKSWAFISGVIGSYEQGEVNREFLYLQSRYNGPRFSLYWIQEVDYNRDWKTDYEDSTVSPTSSLLTVRIRAGRGLTLYAAYDNRERVRLYRDRETPETEFDDANRTGVRAGWNWRSRRHYRLGMDARTDQGGLAGDAETYTVNIGAADFTIAKLGVTARSSYYVNPRAEGWLSSAGTGVNIGRRVRLQVGGGLRDETLINPPVPTLPVPGTPSPAAESRVTWYTVDLDVNLGRHWYMLISAERTTSELEDTEQLYSALSYRF